MLAIRHRRALERIEMSQPRRDQSGERAPLDYAHPAISPKRSVVGGIAMGFAGWIAMTTFAYLTTLKVMTGGTRPITDGAWSQDGW